jgi:DNA gyrase/topoisomerase IV subunit B
MHLINVRKRPGMYIGDTNDGTGLQNMIKEVVSFAIRDVVRAGSGRIDIFLNPDGSCVVRDSGWGLSTQPGKHGFASAEEVLTQLHSRAAIDLEAAWSGYNSVGLCVVNALSERLAVRSMQDGQEHSMRFERGETKVSLTNHCGTQEQGTEFTFRPDPEIFGEVRADLEALVAWLRAIDLPNLPMTIAVSSGDGPEERQVILNCAGGSITE